MKKIILTFLALLSISNFIYSQIFQNSYFWNQNNFHDLNIEPINDNSGDIIVTGNLFNPNMNSFTPVAMRVDSTGNELWTSTLSATGYQNLRVFDSEVFSNGNMVATTGTVDVSGIKKAFIATFELSSGLLIDNNYFEIVSPNFNSTALHISYTETDANNNGNSDPGFIIGGFFSNSYVLDTASMNIGFVLRTSLNLQPIWTIEIDNTASGTQDYNMANNIIETNDGYFITGASNDTNTSQQAVMAHKINFQGSFMWDASYVYGNSRDVSVDAYYDSNSDQIYMLSNYSVSHQFGVTVLDNNTGAINTAWVASELNGNLNHYGFTIEESDTNSNNLIITGYNRQNNFTDTNGNNVTSQSNIFIYEFDKATVNQIGHSKTYLVPHTEPVGDAYNFWNAQMPLIYYPEISASTSQAVNFHYVIGYRTQPNYTEANLFKTLPNFENICLFTDNNFTPNTITNTVATNVTSGSTPIQTFSMTITHTGINPITKNCNGEILQVENFENQKNNYLYPNPTTNFIYTTATNATKYKIYDSLGRIVSLGNIPQNKAISLESLKEGFYYIKIIDSKNNFKTFKISKK